MNELSDESQMCVKLSCISPIDGRYASYTKPLQAYFSEYAYFKYRLHVEISYLCVLLQKIPTYSSLKESDIQIINSIMTEFTITECMKIKEIEKSINHDVKSIEYYICNTFLLILFKKVYI